MQAWCYRDGCTSSKSAWYEVIIPHDQECFEPPGASPMQVFIAALSDKDEGALACDPFNFKVGQSKEGYPRLVFDTWDLKCDEFVTYAIWTASQKKLKPVCYEIPNEC